MHNAWYVAAWERDLGDRPVALTMLGVRVVLSRKTDGSVAALEDACAHRKPQLSMGRIVGDQIECGYHGLTFDCSGVCTLAPRLEKPPRGARVRAYPVESRYGLLWVWMGNPALADASTIFTVEHWGDPAWGLN